MEEKSYWLGFSTIPGIGPAKFKKLLEEFKTAKAAWEAKKPEFSIKNYLKELKKRDVWFITLLDEEYPELLKEIKNPPFVLYGKGNKELLSARQPHVSDDAQQINLNLKQNSASLNKIRRQTGTQPNFNSSESGLPHSTIGVVGARKTTEYGREVTKLLVTELVLNELTIVSGLALGVDAVSHMTALENNGKTIAVLGCGVDCCNPGENQSIYNSILQSGNSPHGEAAGCIISEFPLGMRPTQWTFPARNRIIAGLSQAVLVTEGAEDSGSLITAEFALKFGRKVFAVPGPITSQMSKGPYKLISKGAKLVTNVEDILDELKISNLKSQIPNKSKKQMPKGDTKDENLILKILQNEPLYFDEIVKKTKFESSKLGSILSLMEIKGMVKSLNNGLFSITS